MTDSDGHFEFTFPNEINALEGNGAVTKVSTLQTGAVNPPYTLMARKPGFLTESGRNLNLESGPKEITISLVPEALITGHIALPTADAPDRVQVEIYRPRNTRWAPTLGSGRQYQHAFEWGLPFR